LGIDNPLRPLAYLLVVNTGMIGRDQYQIQLRDYRLFHSTDFFPAHWESQRVGLVVGT
jgi:hypothetical protein